MLDDLARCLVMAGALLVDLQSLLHLLGAIGCLVAGKALGQLLPHLFEELLKDLDGLRDFVMLFLVQVGSFIDKLFNSTKAPASVCRCNCYACRHAWRKPCKIPGAIKEIVHVAPLLRLRSIARRLSSKVVWSLCHTAQTNLHTLHM